MKKLVKIGILIGLSVVSTAYADTPASKEYVDQTFALIQQTLDDMKQKLEQVNNNE